MYGSLSAGDDKPRRTPLCGTVLLYLQAAVMAKSPEWLIAVLSPSELEDGELRDVAWLDGVVLRLWDLALHGH